MANVKEMTRPATRVIEAHIYKVMQPFIEQLDLGHEITLKSYDQKQATFEVTVSVGDITLEDTDRGKAFIAYASHYGLEPKHLGVIFKSNGALFRITGLKTSRPKYPICAERVGDGRAYKFTARQVQEALVV